MRTSLEGYPGNTVVVSLYIPEMPWACFVLLCFVSHQNWLELEKWFSLIQIKRMKQVVSSAVFQRRAVQALRAVWLSSALLITQHVDCQDKTSAQNELPSSLLP